jgi:hypothetical protein
LDDAVELIVEMKAMLKAGGPDAPREFLEAFDDLQQKINGALTAALVPVLTQSQRTSIE